ncbi:MAG TPA: hypothetical protein VGG28_21095, partial [Kofleriaceae bacterium]
PNLTCTIAQGNAVGIQKWYEDSVTKGADRGDATRTGSLEYLGPDKKEVLFRINFTCGLLKMEMHPSTANSSEIKRMKFEIWVETMSLDAESLQRG